MSLLFNQLEVLYNGLADIVLNSRFSKVAGAIVTLICLFKFISHFYKGLRLYVWAQLPFNRVDLVRRYGKWVLVSGGTDGIGLAMAKDLARRGHSLVILGRNKTKLANVQKVLADEPGVGEIVTHEIDFSYSPIKNYDKVSADIEQRDIGILINAAGVHYNEIQRYHHRDIGLIHDQVSVNVLSYIFLTRIVLPNMVKKGSGMVVNISSVLAASPPPFTTLYGPCKLFINAFSRVLQTEYTGYPIDVVNITPGPVETKMISGSSQSIAFALFTVTPEVFASRALNAASTRVKDLCGGFLHEVCYIIVKAIAACNLFDSLFLLFHASGSKFNTISPKLKRRNT